MKFTVITFFAVALMALATACSSGGGGGGKGNDKAGGDGGNGGGAAQPDALTAQPWCHNDNQKMQQDRMVLSPDGKFLYEVYALDAQGRGQNLGQATGTWSVENNNTLVLTPEGQQTARLNMKYVDKTQSPDGAAQVVVQDTTYNPCN